MILNKYKINVLSKFIVFILWYSWVCLRTFYWYLNLKVFWISLILLKTKNLLLKVCSKIIYKLADFLGWKYYSLSWIVTWIVQNNSSAFFIFLWGSWTVTWDPSNFQPNAQNAIQTLTIYTTNFTNLLYKCRGGKLWFVYNKSNVH